MTDVDVNFAFFGKNQQSMKIIKLGFRLYLTSLCESYVTVSETSPNIGIRSKIARFSKFISNNVFHFHTANKP